MNRQFENSNKMKYITEKCSPCTTTTRAYVLKMLFVCAQKDNIDKPMKSIENRVKNTLHTNTHHTL